ncbi:MAG: glycosyltransferase, partial [Mycobacteriaceae bacterium]
MTTTQQLAKDTTTSKAVSLLQRVILPRVGDPLDLRSLYLDEDETNRKRSRATSRTELELPGESEVSFATYFNAFAAGYWRRWTVLEQVVLQLRVQGECRIDVYRSKADSTQIHLEGITVTSEAETTHEFVLDLAPFEDGGWIWFDITTESGGVQLLQAGWFAPVESTVRASVAIGITTFNRPDDCAAALAAIGEDPRVLDLVDAVFVADQGNKKLVDAAAFPAAAGALGERLRIHDQGNLGGSGGFARGMYEALNTTDCEQILLMDDDIVIEPDSILRAVAFSRFTDRPTLVGGQMLNLQARSHLHSMGEVVDPEIFMWRAAPNVQYD